LRERREDVPALVDAFIRRFNVEEGKRVVSPTPEALKLLMAHDWPGNVRQLENTVYRAIVLADGPYLQPHDFPAISGLHPAAPLASDAVMVGAGLPTVAQVMASPGDSPVKVLDEKGHLRTLEAV